MQEIVANRETETIDYDCSDRDKHAYKEKTVCVLSGSMWFDFLHNGRCALGPSEKSFRTTLP